MRRKALAASAMLFLVAFLVHAHVPLPMWLGRGVTILMVVSGLVHAGTSMFGSATDRERPASTRRLLAVGIAAVCAALGLVATAGVLFARDAPMPGPDPIPRDLGADGTQ